MLVRFSAFEPRHLDAIAPAREIDQEALLETVAIKDMYCMGPALTAWVEDVPVGAGGIMITKPGVGQAWLLASDKLFKSWRMAIDIRRKLYTIAQDWKLYRVHAFADCRDPRNCRFLEFLGMRLEGIHRKLGPSQSDMATYAWVK